MFVTVTSVVLLLIVCALEMGVCGLFTTVPSCSCFCCGGRGFRLMRFCCGGGKTDAAACCGCACVALVLIIWGPPCAGLNAKVVGALIMVPSAAAAVTGVTVVPLGAVQIIWPAAGFCGNIVIPGMLMGCMLAANGMMPCC